MKQDVEPQLWVAVRVERGFPVEVRGFRKRDPAIRVEERWRRKMNPDYDETAVLPLNV
ncbi:MAG: hypothetical protein ACYTE3_19520 [Planctomycetota bacterium]|jgi:hypothetical protein